MDEHTTDYKYSEKKITNSAERVRNFLRVIDIRVKPGKMNRIFMRCERSGNSLLDNENRIGNISMPGTTVAIHLLVLI